jgi:hypothetical protein
VKLLTPVDRLETEVDLFPANKKRTAHEVVVARPIINIHVVEPCVIHANIFLCAITDVLDNRDRILGLEGDNKG